MRIVYCINSLSSLGGTEITTIEKAVGLAKIPGNSVWIITCCDDSLRSCIPVPEKVGVLGIKNELSMGFPWNIVQFCFRKKAIKKKLADCFRQINPDIVVSTGGLEKWIIPSIEGNWARVRESHVVKGFEDGKSSFPVRAVSYLSSHLDHLFNVDRFDRTVVLTEEEKTANWDGCDAIEVIPNPLRFKQCKIAKLENKSIIAVGRLVDSKDFPSLLRVFAKVVERFPDWTLDIYGEGEERNALSSLIDTLGLSLSVSLKNSVIEIQEKMMEYSLLVCTSKHESFCMTLIEAMSCGLPVVSYACPLGRQDMPSY